MRKLAAPVALLFLTGLCAQATLLTNGDLDNQSNGPFVGLAFGHNVNELAPGTVNSEGNPLDHDAYAQIYGWMGTGKGIEVQAFNGNPNGPGPAHSGSLHVELDVGNYDDQETDWSLWGTQRDGGMYQNVSVPNPGYYRLSFYYRARPDYPEFGADQKYIGETHPNGGLSTFAIGIYIDGVQIGVVDVGSSTAGGPNVVKKSLGDFDWEEFTFDFALLGVDGAEIIHARDYEVAWIGAEQESALGQDDRK